MKITNFMVASIGNINRITEKAFREIIHPFIIPSFVIANPPIPKMVSPGIVNGKTIKIAKTKIATHRSRFIINRNGIFEM